MPSRSIRILGIAIALCVVVAGAAFAGFETDRTDARSSTFGSPSAAPQKVVTIGDSIMAGLGLKSSQAWPALLATDDHVQVKNLGCSGAGFIAIGSCGTDYAGLISDAVADHPNVVIIQSSDNDLGQTQAALDAETTRTMTALHDALPDARIVAFNTLWDQPTAAPAEIAFGTAAIEQASQAVGGKYVDLGQPLRGQLGMMQSDNEHPTAAGQELLVSTIRTALDKAKIAL